MRTHIIYQNFLDRNGKKMSIGGIQTYLLNLSEVLKGIDSEVYIYQEADIPFNKKFDGINVSGFVYKGKNIGLPKYLYKCARKNMSIDDLLIFGDDSFIVKSDINIKIAIQHGVFWDKPERTNCSDIVYFLDYCLKAFRSWKIIKRIRNVNQVVCVDYNFPNWYRALVAHPQVNLKVIPNFSEIPDCTKKESKNNPIRIIFARRFFDYRGTRIFAAAISRILDKYINIEVTVAGDGPDGELLHNKLDKYANVLFVKYESQDSLRIHSDKDIAIVPTLGSEGTSLSLLEAMASRCAVICTSVGGMTNIVINGYNGIMIAPNEEELFIAIEKLIIDKNFQVQLSEKAYETVKTSFSKNSWSEQWKEIIKCTYNL